MRLFIVILFLNFLSSAQVDSLKTIAQIDSCITIPMIGINVGGQLPFADMDNRFGPNLKAGGSCMIKTSKNWIFGIEYNVMFGRNVREDVLVQLKNSDGFVVDNEGLPADLRVTERGMGLHLTVGKIFKLASSNPNSGLMVSIGGGYMQHKINLYDAQHKVAAIKDNLKFGFDRLSAGFSVSQFLGYMFLSDNRLLNFYGGFECYQSFTKSLRKMNYDTGLPDTSKRLDVLAGIRFGWILPLYKKSQTIITTINPSMFIYNLVVRTYGLIISIAAFKNLKARDWISGRKNWKLHLAKNLAALKSGNRLWVHCASYGEFEQGKPLIEAIRKQHPHYTIILSFFSPSGYTAFKNWPGADLVCYLPLDTSNNARTFINLVNPEYAVFIKYEFWLNFLFQLKIKSIATYLVSAVFKQHHPFFKWYGAIFKRSLLTFNKLFIQDAASGKLLEGLGINNYEICGDTRFDRVVEIRENFIPLPFFEKFCAKRPVLVAGSTWPGDEELLVAAFLQLSDPHLKLIIAPHQVDDKNVLRLCKLLELNGLKYTLFSDSNKTYTEQILIVDAIGILSQIYHYATVTYIGGGFNSGIHNCLEPAVYLKPVLFFGDDFEKYNEAVDLVNLKAAKSVMDATELELSILSFLNNGAERDTLEKNISKYFEANSGSTKKILASMELR